MQIKVTMSVEAHQTATIFVDVPENWHDLSETEKGDYLHAEWEAWSNAYIDGAYEELEWSDGSAKLLEQ